MTDTDPDTETHRTVDISADADTPDAADTVSDTSAGAENVRDRGKQEAERYLKEADGQTPSQRAEHAIEELRQTVSQTEQQLRAVRQQKQEKESRREKLADTRVRIENQPDERAIMQTLGGGITLDVPPADGDVVQTVDQEDVHIDHDAPDHDGEWDGVYDRDDLVTDITETRETLADQIASLDTQAEKLADALAVGEAAFEKLQDYKEMAAVEDHEQQQQPPHRRQQSPGVPEHSQGKQPPEF